MPWYRTTLVLHCWVGGPPISGLHVHTAADAMQVTDQSTNPECLDGRRRRGGNLLPPPAAHYIALADTTTSRPTKPPGGTATPRTAQLGKNCAPRRLFTGPQCVRNAEKVALADRTHVHGVIACCRCRTARELPAVATLFLVNCPTAAAALTRPSRPAARRPTRLAGTLRPLPRRLRAGRSCSAPQTRSWRHRCSGRGRRRSRSGSRSRPGRSLRHKPLSRFRRRKTLRQLLRTMPQQVLGVVDS